MMKRIPDRSMTGRIIAGILAIVLSISFEGSLAYDTLIVEEHMLPTAMADGKYDGEKSRREVGGEQKYEDAEKKRSINILEVVPDKRMAMIGYTIAGQEPIGLADMDAIVNTYPGQDAGWRPNFTTCNGYNVNNRSNTPAITDLAMNSGKESALYYYAETMNGYYKYVGAGKGVYALKEIPGEWDSNRRARIDNIDYVKDVVMVSKYKDKSNRFATGFDYIWVEDKSLGSFSSESVDHKTTVENVDKGKDIYVYNHKKNKYVNNELFLCFMCDICSGLNHNMGAYSGAVTGGGPSFLDIPENRYQWPQDKRIKPNSNYDRIQEWRETFNIAVNTREPGEVTVEDVDNADLIVVCRGDSDGSYKTAFAINCYAFNDYSPKKEIGVDGNDFSLDVLKRIYKHVVVEGNGYGDVAIAYSCETAPNPKYFNTNVGRLGCMLFYINNHNADDALAEGESRAGTGRDFFKNLLKDYGRIKNGNNYETDPNDTIDKIEGTPVTDLIYIGEDGGLYINGGKSENESGGWDEGQAKFYRAWLFNNDLRSFYYKGYINEWIDNSMGNNYVNEDFNGLGFYALDSYISGQYRNQLFYVEDYLLYQYSDSGKAKNLFGIMSKIDPTPHYVIEDGTQEKYGYLSMNIINGDSVTPNQAEGSQFDYHNNKVLYINKYEIDKMSDSYTLPVDIEIKTSHKITKISVKKKNGTIVHNYSSAGGVMEGGGSLDGLGFEDKTQYDAHGKAPYNEAKDYYTYTLKASIPLVKSVYSSGANNTIIVEAINEANMNATDMITIVTRDFFMLN